LIIAQKLLLTDLDAETKYLLVLWGHF
jgi:hypothetical protein